MTSAEFIEKATAHIRSLEIQKEDGSTCAMYEIDEFLADMFNAIPKLENEFEFFEKVGRYVVPDWIIFSKAIKQVQIPDWVLDLP